MLSPDRVMADQYDRKEQAHERPAGEVHRRCVSLLRPAAPGSPIMTGRRSRRHDLMSAPERFDPRNREQTQSGKGRPKQLRHPQPRASGCPDPSQRAPQFACAAMPSRSLLLPNLSKGGG
jgi:hypothetical protein